MCCKFLLQLYYICSKLHQKCISLSQDFLPPKKLIILRHESLDKDLQDNFKGFKFLTRRINTSLYSDLAELVLKNKRLREIVESDPRHRKDLDIFY